jgi:nitrite reductase (NADH) small subunit
MNCVITTASEWFRACKVEDVPDDGGVCVRHKHLQIALFHFTRRNEWYASENRCPHRQQMAISRGMLGSAGEEPKVACPFHKKTFSLIDGRCMNSDEGFTIKIYPVKVEDNYVYIKIDGNSGIVNHECSNQAFEK